MKVKNISLADKVLKELRNKGPKALASKTYRYSRHHVMKVLIRVFPILASKSKYTNDQEFYFVSNPIFQIDSNDMVESEKAISQTLSNDIKSATWFVPYFNHLAYGGIYTIFRFIAYLDSKGVENNIVIYDKPDLKVDSMMQEIKKSFPEIKRSKITVIDTSTQDINKLPASDIAFCTFWVSAYLLLKFNKTKRKYYFIQDYEPLFYPGGATFALAESTYRFGFSCVVNTPGLLAAINQRHGSQGVSFIPAVDRSVYYPSEAKKKGSKTRIFFYARPNNPRNAFNLGMQIVRQLIDIYGDGIEIVTAGADWHENKYGLKGKITNLGLIKSIGEVADLYRTCDIGFVYMLSKHPSYQPFEFMASGMATVTNNNEDNLWLLRDGENCLVSEPSPKAMVEKISLLIEDEKLRSKIIANGIKTVDNEWQWQLDTVWNEIANGRRQAI